MECETVPETDFSPTKISKSNSLHLMIVFYKTFNTVKRRMWILVGYRWGCSLLILRIIRHSQDGPLALCVPLARRADRLSRAFHQSQLHPSMATSWAFCPSTTSHMTLGVIPHPLLNEAHGVSQCKGSWLVGWIPPSHHHHKPPIHLSMAATVHPQAVVYDDAPHQDMC